MANEIKIILSADGSGVKVVTGDITSQFEKMGKAAKDATATAASESDAFIASLKKQAEQAGKTREELLTHQASILGVSDAAKPYIDSIAKAAEHTETFGFNTARSKTELLVLAHEMSQGNFQRFGGSMMVLGEQTGAAALLFSGAGLAALGLAGAVAAATYAVVKGAQEQKAMHEALIMTGNYAGTTTAGLDALAHSAVATGGSLREAKTIVTELAASGKYTAEQIGTVSEAVMALEHATGGTDKSVEKLVKQFESLSVQATDHSRYSDAISKATLKLDDEYHFLTASVYEQIRALELEGQQKDASKLATDEFAKVTKERADEINTNLGTVARSWRGIKDAIGEAVSAVGEYGKKATAASRLADGEAELKKLQQWQNDSKDTPNGLEHARANSAVAAQEQKVIDLKKELFQINERAAAQGVAAKVQSEGAHAAAGIDAMDLRIKGGEYAKLIKDVNEYNAQLEHLRAADPKSSALNQDAIDAHMAGIIKLDQATTPKKGVDEVAKALAFYNDLMDQSSGYTKTYAEDQNKLALALKTGKISYQQYAEAAQKLLDQQPLMKDAAKAQETATKAYDDALKGIQSSAANEAESLTKAIDAQRLHNAEIGKTPEQVELAKRAEQDRITDMLQGNADILESAITLAAAQDGFDKATLTLWDEKLKSLRDQVALRHQLAGELATGAALEGADQLAKTNKKAAEESSKYWEDALMRAFESGKGFFQSLWDTIKHTMETQVLKVMVSATGLTGMTAAGASESGGVGGALSLATGIDKLTTSMGNMASAFNGSGLAGFAKSGIGQSMGLSTAATAGNNASAYVGPQLTDTGSILAGMPIGGILSAYSIGGVKGFATGVATTALAGGVAASIAGTGFAAGATGALAAIGPWGWAAMGAAALFGMGSDGPSVQGTGEGSRTYDATGNVKATTSKDAWGGMSASTDQGITSLAASYMLTAAKLGIKTVETQFSVGSNIMSDGSDPKFAISGGAVGHGIAGAETAYSADAYNLQASRVVFAALQGSELPKYLAGVFDGITASSATQDQITSALTAAEALGTFHAQLLALPAGFQKLADTSYTAMQNIASLSGGMDKLQTNLSTYYTNFYTTEEQRAQTIANINKATAGSGLDAATATRNQFRAIVEAQDLSTESGRKMYAALLSVSGAFAGIATAATDLLTKLNKSASTAMTVLTKAVDAERTRITDIYTAQSDAVQASLDAVGVSIGKLQTLSQSLKSTLDGMRVIGSDSAYREQAQAQISAAVAAAKATGALPLDGELTSALSTVSKPSENLFANFQDYARDFYKTANDISTLSDLTGSQLTADEVTQGILNNQLSTLKAFQTAEMARLDKVVSTAQAQLDAANGTYIGVVSIAEALTGVNNTTKAVQQTNQAAGNSSGVVTVGGAGVSAASLGSKYAVSTMMPTGAAVTQSVTEPDQIAKFDSISAYINTLDFSPAGANASVATLAATAKSYGVTIRDLATASGYAYSDVAALFTSRGIPAFDVGTNFVPNDMIAQIHEGEAIVPKAYNPAAGGQNNDALIAEMQQLRQSNERLESRLAAIEGNTKKLAGQFDTATEGGRAMLTEVYA